MIKYPELQVQLLAFSGAFNHIPQSSSSNVNVSGVIRCQWSSSVAEEDSEI